MCVCATRDACLTCQVEVAVFDVDDDDEGDTDDEDDNTTQVYIPELGKKKL